MRTTGATGKSNGGIRNKNEDRSSKRNFQGTAATGLSRDFDLHGVLHPRARLLQARSFSKTHRRSRPDGTGAPPVLLCCGHLFLIPGTVFVGFGAVLFGPYLGFACVWPGTLAGAVISWFAARMLGREFVCSFIGSRLTKYDELIERNGFRAVLLLRLMFVPLGLINYGVGLTKVRFWDYFFATALGEAATIFGITFFIGELREIWISRDLCRLLSARMALSVGFLIALVFVAKLIQSKYRKCG